MCACVKGNNMIVLDNLDLLFTLHARDYSTKKLETEECGVYDLLTAIIVLVRAIGTIVDAVTFFAHQVATGHVTTKILIEVADSRYLDRIACDTCTTVRCQDALVIAGFILINAIISKADHSSTDDCLTGVCLN